MLKIVFKGTVFSGSGDGKNFVDLPWVIQQIERKLGFSPYSGTLNIHLAKESVKKRIFLENVKGIEIEPQVGYCPGMLFKACLSDLECTIVVPKVPNYPRNVLEIIASVCLREHLKLEDGSLVTVVVSV